MHRAHDRLVELVDEDPALSGTSTTATVLAFDGTRIGIGHVGDSRAYLYRDGAIRQLTIDHTFVQTLIDEGRITEEEARVHPHRNLIMRAIDAVSDSEPDLFVLDLVPGDRLLVCSDGACGVLEDARMADILSTGTPEYAAVELVRASLEAGSTDNVTCVVADVLEAGDAERPTTPSRWSSAPRPSGGSSAAAPAGSSAATARATPASSTRSPPTCPTTRRTTPSTRRPGGRRATRRARRAGTPGPSASSRRRRGRPRCGSRSRRPGRGPSTSTTSASRTASVVIFRGLNADPPGFDLSEPYQTTDVELDRLTDFDAGKVENGIDADDLADAQTTVQNLAANQEHRGTDDGAG